MKKKYISPEATLVLLETENDVMWSGGDISDPFAGVNGYSLPNSPNGTVVNNNGAPTFVPGGNGGGGRQTPLG